MTADGMRTAVVPAGLDAHWRGNDAESDTGSPNVTVPTIGVPPRTELADNEKPVSAFTPQVNTSRVLVALTPAGVVTVTSPDEPLVPDGDVAAIAVSELTEKESAGTPPKDTEDAPVKCAPVMVTGVPPSGLPNPGLTPVTTGTVVAAFVVVVVAVGEVVLWQAAPAAARAIRKA